MQNFCDGLLCFHCYASDQWTRSVTLTLSAIPWPGTMCISGSIDCSARVWDVRSGRCLSVKQGHTDEVRTVWRHLSLVAKDGP